MADQSEVDTDKPSEETTSMMEHPETPYPSPRSNCSLHQDSDLDDFDTPTKSSPALQDDMELDTLQDQNVKTPPSTNGYINPFARKRPLPPDASPSPKRTRVTPTLLLPEPLTPVSLKRREGEDGQVDDGAIERDAEGSENERARVDQWKVGKRPGHQGSHIRGEESKKRTLNESITSNVERVLKKPFKPPAKIVLTRTKPRSFPPTPRSSEPKSSPPLDTFGLTNTISHEPEPFPLDLPTSQPIRRTQDQSKKLIKPFKPPARVVKPLPPLVPSQGEPSISAKQGQGGVGGVTLAPSKTVPKKFKSDKEKLKEINEKISLLKRAIHILDHPEEDEAIKNSIVQWKEAGQEITDLLFGIVDRPNDVSAHVTNRPLWGFSHQDEFSEAQGDVLKDVNRDEEGEVVDRDGNRIDWEEGFGGIDKLIEVEQIIADKRDKDTEYVPDRWITARPREEESRLYCGQDSTLWNQGTMLFKMGIQPELLGWNAIEEDWTRGEEEQSQG